jgi:hypothetical protein
LVTTISTPPCREFVCIGIKTVDSCIRNLALAQMR